MQFIQPSVTLIREKDPFKKIELAARTCYKSEASITDDSAKSMYDRLRNSKHLAMLEHTAFVFQIDEYTADDFNAWEADTQVLLKPTFLHLTYNKFQDRWLLSGNLRALLEFNNSSVLYALYKEYPNLFTSEEIGVLLDAEADEVLNGYYGRIPAKLVKFESLKNKSKEEIKAHRYTTMRFVTDRGVSHEIVRHRLFSFAQESTRYVNYGKKGEITYIVPAKFAGWSSELKEIFLDGIKYSENSYRGMIAKGAKPQEARAVLPNAVKTEIVVTGNDEEWQHFFDLRSRGTTGAPHPDMKEVADKALDIYKNLYKL